MILARIINSIRDRHINRGFAQLEAHTRATDGEGVLQLTEAHMLAYIDMRLAARKLFRKDRQAAAHKAVETRRKAA